MTEVVKRPRLGNDSADMANKVDIDDSLYSRQRYVLGDSAMQRMAKSSVLLSGLGGLGVEIAKNIVLAGIKSLTIQDEQIATFADLGTQFFLREDDVKQGKNRAVASAPRLSELNPYVGVNTCTTAFNATSDLDFLKEFQCVVLTEASLALQLRVNSFCRQQNPPIKFITADVYGVFCWTFCDFGDSFEVVDTNGEEPKEVFIAKITKGSPGDVTTLENRMHGFETGDTVTFREVKGMTALNGKACQIKVLSPYAFTICDTSGAEFAAYLHGGIATQVKVPKTVNFDSLEKQLKAPSLLTPDLSKLEAPVNIHLGMLALWRFREQHGRMPNVRCAKDAEELLKMAESLNQQNDSKVDSMDKDLLRKLSYTCQGCFAPLCAALGGVVAQEALKALTGKFTPLNQWLHLDASEVLTGLDKADSQSFLPQQNRYDALRICIGEELCRKLADLKLFMVGCGAIGCEMLKNYALLGLGSTQQGQITITDNDLIEKSNLNRQFLFRPHHIRKPKSTTAAESAKDINSALRFDAQQYKVCPQTEEKVYTDTFFEQQDIMVNALDNVEARRYMDSRCLTTQRPLLESGTMGAKGHVQVIVQHVTESYTSQRDPQDEDVPYCTLKSFPAQIEHCIQWARDKFESSFTQKPQMYSKFWSASNPEDIAKCLEAGQMLEGAIQVSKLAEGRPSTWQHCVAMARLKFEKYFNHKAKHLLHAFPLDIKLQDGSLFWQSPKRPPTPQEFDINSELHCGFVLACAQLYADINRVPYKKQDQDPAKLPTLLKDVKVKEFKPTSKTIVTEESAKKPEPADTTGDDLEDSALRLRKALKSEASKTVFSQMAPLCFEKDDDDNGHIDFINTASNLRASMYNIEVADRLKTKRIAGRIVPAIATTTAAVAGLVTVELIKVVQQVGIEHYKNCFLNLALPVFLFSEPGATENTKLSNGMTFSQWDRWEVIGNKDFTLKDLLKHFQGKYKLEVSLVVHGVKMVYVPIMPGHKKRLPHPMTKLIKPPDSKKYVDLVVSYVDPTPGNDDQMGPPVRYYFTA